MRSDRRDRVVALQNLSEFFLNLEPCGPEPAAAHDDECRFCDFTGDGRAILDHRRRTRHLVRLRRTAREGDQRP